VGDVITHMEGQPVVSVADGQWVLHRAPVEGSVRTRVRRGDRTKALTIELPEGWRRRWDFTWRASAGHFQQLLLGMNIRIIPTHEREGLGLDEGALAFRVHRLVRPGGHFSGSGARRAGIQAWDVVSGVDGWTRHVSKGQLFAYLLLVKKPGDTVTLTILRAGRKKDYVVELSR
jgi:S1-C subfamily serine protease